MTALLRELQRIIAIEGPVTVERYMALCLSHPRHGYYVNRDPFGPDGDFTTAPEISQMFGELIGLWAIEVWRSMGAPEAIALVELGPGRGTLMADLLRAARIVPAFSRALAIHLVETSPSLRERQRQRLGGAAHRIAWHSRFEEAPEGPAIIIANEFFDTLPARQFVRTHRGWCERLVGLGPGERLTFGLAAEPDPALTLPAREGDVLAWSPVADDIAGRLAARLAEAGGAALVIDYGHVRSGFGDTLQAVRRHAFTDPLLEPGAADLTVHVDFARLGRVARSRGAAVHGPLSQGAFLRALGIETRARMLKARADPAQAAAIDAALSRLTDERPTGMGALFKVLCLAHPGLPPPPSFPPGASFGET